MAKIKDVMESASDAYKLLLENDKLRVMEVHLKPGQKARMHNHPNDHLVYVLKDAKFRLESPEGTKTEIDLKTGSVIWMKAGSHETENIGSKDGLNLVIEVK